jgi:hypothetical protein
MIVAGSVGAARASESLIIFMETEPQRVEAVGLWLWLNF